MCLLRLFFLDHRDLPYRGVYHQNDTRHGSRDKIQDEAKRNNDYAMEQKNIYLYRRRTRLYSIFKHIGWTLALSWSDLTTLDLHYVWHPKYLGMSII